MAYIQKVIEKETKNYKETDTELVTGYMPQLLKRWEATQAVSSEEF